MNYFFGSLLGLYRNRILRFATSRPAGTPKGTPVRPDKIGRVRYQKVGQNLRRISLRLEESTWVELRMLSLASGWSMSRILVYLVVWEYQRRLKFAKRGWTFPDYQVVGTPTANTIHIHYEEAIRELFVVAHFSASEPLIDPPWYRNIG